MEGPCLSIADTDQQGRPLMARFSVSASLSHPICVLPSSHVLRLRFQWPRDHCRTAARRTNWAMTGLRFRKMSWMTFQLASRSTPLNGRS